MMKIGRNFWQLAVMFLLGLGVGYGLWFKPAPLTPHFKPLQPAGADLNEPIDINTVAEAEAKRLWLTQLIWGESHLPPDLPDKITPHLTDPTYTDLANLQEITRLEVNLEYGLSSVMYHFKPQQANGLLMVYHQGHEGDFRHGKETIRALVERGFEVIAMTMPLEGMNGRPTVHIEHLGQFTFSDHHDQLKFLAPTHGHTLKYFLHPVMVAVNYAQQHGHPTVDMVGLSGGGWTTVLAAALDPRIQRSYPVAGSLPLYLRPQGEFDWGEYEQTLPEVYLQVNYSELYVLGAMGAGRRQWQVFNVYDPCCFAGRRYEAYVGGVAQRVQALGAGDFAVYADSSHQQHQISRRAILQIMADVLPLTPTHPLTANFSNLITLQGYDLQQRSTQAITFYWQAQRPSPVPLTLFVHVVNAQGERLAQVDTVPTWATDTWQAPEQFTQAVILPRLPLTGTHLEVGWYYPVTGQTVPVNESNQVTITP